MLDRRRLEIATSNATLGMLADEVLIATIHYSDGNGLDGRDRSALERASTILRAVTELDTRQIATGPVLRTMAPLGALDETVVQVTSASGGDKDDLGQVIGRCISDMESLLNGIATPDQVQRVRALFQRLADITLARSDEIGRPSRDDRQQWINRALNS